MSEEELLDKVSEIAFDKLSEAGDRMDQLAEPYKTIAIIYSAQEIIDNGGLQYERIGRVRAAQSIRNAAATFGIPSPEKDVNVRRAYIEANYNEDSFAVTGWNDCICGDEKVWSDLVAWIRSQPDFTP